MQLALWVCLIITVLSSSSLWAANHYIRPDVANDASLGCQYNGDGTTWACAASAGATGAFNNFPNGADFVRGDTYFISTGTWGNPSVYRFNKAVDGTTYIYIKKATVSAHGSDTGWADGLGTGQAEFVDWGSSAGISFDTGYWDFDGVTGSGSDPTTYGISITAATCSPRKSDRLIGLPSSYSNVNPTNLIIKHIAFNGCDLDVTDTACMAMIQSTPNYTTETTLLTGIVVANNYFGHHNQNAVYLLKTDGAVISDNYFAGNQSNTDHCHGEMINLRSTTNMTIKNNFLTNWRTYAIGVHTKMVGTVNNDDVLIYNNIFDGNLSSGAGETIYTIGSASAGYNDVGKRFKIYHNTFINMNSTGTTIEPLQITSSDDYWDVKNNLFYNSAKVAYGDEITNSYNAYLKVTTYPAEANSQVDASASDPFTDSATGDYTLKTGTLPIDHGTSLAATYNTDKAGTGRPVNTVWDIGAYEFTGTPVYTVTPSGANCTVSPNTGVSVESGQTATVTMTGDYGYTASAGGTCGGTLSSGTYTTSAITSDCTVTCTGLPKRGVLGGTGTVSLGGSGVALLGN